MRLSFSVSYPDHLVFESRAALFGGLVGTHERSIPRSVDVFIVCARSDWQEGIVAMVAFEGNVLHEGAQLNLRVDKSAEERASARILH